VPVSFIFIFITLITHTTPKIERICWEGIYFSSFSS